MIKLSGIGKSYGARRVLDAVSFNLNARECAGLVGPNGCGKTTLLRIIAGADRPDSGAVTVARGVRIGYLRQGLAGAETVTAADAFPSLFAAAGATDAGTAVPVSRRDVERARRALRLRPVAPDERIDTLSGGEQTKLGLLDLLASAPDALLLDEPTNNLDLDGLAWLDAYLTSFAGPVLLVSHDRALLDDHAAVILEIDPASGRIEPFRGGYADYAREKARRQADVWARYRVQQRREQRIERSIAGLKARAMRTEQRTINFHYRKRALKVARRAVTLERRLRRELETPDRVEKPLRRPYRIKPEIAEAPRSGDRMLHVDAARVEAGGRVLLDGADVAIGWGERVVLIGPNGSGKTTLLRAVLGQHPWSAGSAALSPSAHPGYLPQVEPPADGGATPLDVIRAAAPLSETEARRFLHRFLFSGDQPLTPVARLSYGERRRLALARLVAGGANLLLLDEPENHLDIPSREALEAALDEYEGAMLAVTHDRYFIERFAERVIAIDGTRLREL